MSEKTISCKKQERYYVFPSTELSMSDLVPSVEQRKRDVVPSTEPSKSDLFPSNKPIMRDVAPSLELSRKDVVPSIEPSKNDLVPSFDPSKEDDVLSTEPSNTDVVPSILSRANRYDATTLQYIFNVIFSSDKSNALELVKYKSLHVFCFVEKEISFARRFNNKNPL
jgi:hypothetical protein